MKTKTLSILLVITMLLTLFTACAQENEQQTGYDGKVFDISEMQDGSLTLKSEKVGNDYKLTVSGTGKAIDYDKKEAVPWNVISKKVVSVTIEDGAESLGEYYFYSINLESVILPASVKEVGSTTFNPYTVIYSYSTTEVSTPNAIYYYKEDAPDQMNKYFRIVDGVPRVWKTASVLFIGNSFTYYPDYNNPTVPYVFGQIVKNLDQAITVDKVVKGSHTLTKFANETDEMGAIVKQKLSENKYDYIVLQEQSTAPLNSYNAFNNAVKSLSALIESTQDNAKVYLYQTWGFPAGIQSAGYKSVTEMSASLCTAYDKCGKENGLPVTHVGNAFAVAYDDNKIDIFYSDQKHQGYIGAYLSACCHACSMLGLDVRNCTYHYDFNDNGRIDEDEQNTCKTLQTIAYNATKG